MEQRHLHRARVVWLRRSDHFQPDMHEACDAAFAGGKADGDFFRLQRDAFSASPSNSIDYAVMEQLGTIKAPASGVVVPLACRLVGRGFVGRGLGHPEKDADRQRGPRARDVRRRGVDLRAFGRTPGRLRRHARISWWSKRPTRCWSPTGRACRTSRRSSGRIRKRQRAGSGRPSQGASPVGFLRFRRHGERFQVEAHRREAGRAALAANASSPRRTLGRRARHGARHAR